MRSRVGGSVIVLGALALLLGGLVPRAEAADFAAGSLIIPMDVTYQNNGMFRAYGLVYRLLQSGVPVRWAIQPGKAFGGTDFTATTVDQRTGAAIPGPYAYAGGPFIIDQANAAAALPVITAWWAANGNQPNVHRATLAFTAQVDIVLSQAPRIAIEAINSGIAISYFNAAGIPDASGATWSATSPNVLDQAEIAAGALLDTTGQCTKRKWDVFVTPHNGGYAYSLSDPANLGTRTYAELDEFVALGGGWVALCHSITSNENAIADLYRNGTPAVRALFISSQSSGFLTLDGFSAIANGGGTWTVNPGETGQPLSQAVPTPGAVQTLPGGSVQTWLSTSVSYLAGVERVAWFQSGSNQYDWAVNGVYHGGDGRGKLTFLGGHSYSTSLPYSTNFEAPYLRFFYNSLFFNGAAVAKLDLSATPASIPVGTSTPIQIKLQNSGASVATAVNAVSMTLQPGVSYVGMASGPAPTSVAPGPGGTTVLSWASLPNIAGGTTALVVNAQALFASTGTFTFATFASTYGDVFRESFTVNDCASLTVTPAPLPTIAKTPASQGPVVAGEVVNWTLTYSNTGLVNLVGGVVEDLLPAGFSLQSATPTPASIVPQPDTTTRLRWNVGTLAPGASATITLTAVVPTIASPSQTFTNTATFSGYDASGMLFTGAPSTATVSVVRPKLNLNKSVNLASANPGDTLTYTISPTYEDALLLENAVITDVVPANTTYLAGSANAGGTFDGGTNTVTWVLGSNLPGVPGVTAPTGSALCPVSTTLPPVADTWIDKKDPATNNGGNNRLVTRPNNIDNLTYSMVRFDTSGIPAGSVIQSARFTLTVQTNRAKHFDNVYRMATAWTEGGATWNTRDGTSAWSAGSFSAADLLGTSLGTFVPKTNGAILNVAVTSAVDDWVNRGVANNGLALISSGTDAGDAKYYSREEGTAARRPALTVTYLVPTVGGCSGTTPLTSTADTFVEKGNVTRNNGTATTFSTNPGNNDSTANTKHALLQFDLGSIPPGATITSATLTLNVTTNKNNHIDQIRRVTTPWVEGGATWSTRNGTTPWAGGGAFSSADYAATSYGSVAPTANGPVSVGVASLVNDWVNNGLPNRGLALVSTGTDNGDAKYSSREEGTAADRPVLTVVWTLPPNPAPATTTTLSATPLLLAGSGTVTVTMTVSATGTVTGVTPPPSLTVNAAGPTVTLASGPTPAGPLTIGPGSPATFTYTYNVTPGATVGDVDFSGKPIAGSSPFQTAESNSVLVTPVLSFQATVNSPLAASVTQVQNVASLADDNFFAGGQDSPPAVTTIKRPVLTLTKSNSPTGTVLAGETITYTLVLTNSGLGNATSVVVSDAVPANATYVAGSCSPAVCGLSGGTVTFTVGTVLPSTSRTLTFQVRPSAALLAGTYPIANTASVTAAELTAAVSSNTVTNTASIVPSLAITKAQSAAPPADASNRVTPGTTITYTLSVSNPGIPTATAIVVTDVIPTGATYLPGSASAGGTYDAGTRTLTWNIASLASGASTALTFQVTVDSPASNGSSIVNAATATATGLPAPAASNIVSYEILAAPALTVTKSASPASGMSVAPGGIITYTLLVTNTGTANTTGAYVTDAIPAGTTYVANSTTLNGLPVTELTPGVAPVAGAMSVFSPGMGDPSGDGGLLVVGAANRATVTFQVRVVNPIANGFAILNSGTAAVGSFATCSAPLCVTSNQVNHPVSSPADIAVAKSASWTPGNGNLTYTITVTNLSPSNYASGVSLTETLPAGITIRTGCGLQVPDFCYELTAGSFDATTGVWTVSGTWTTGSPPPLAPGASATLILAVDVDASLVGMTVTNTVSLGSVEQLDAVVANNTASAPVTVAVVTRATIRGLRVDPGGRVEFATGEQRGTVSFELFSTDDAAGRGELTRLSAAPILAPRPNSSTPILYEASTAPITAEYLLIEETDIRGRRHMMGPFRIGDARLRASYETIEARLLRGDAESGLSPATTRGGARFLSHRREKQMARKLRAEATRRSPALKQLGSGALLVETRGPGEVGVTRAQLEAAGMPARLPLSKLRLQNLGRQVPFWLAGDELRFRAEELGTTYTAHNAYVVSWLGSGRRPSVALSLPEAPAPAGFVRVKKSFTYVASAPQEIDPWLWDLLWGDGTTWPYEGWTWTPDVNLFDLPGLAPGASGQVPVRISLWAWSDGRHRVEAWLNGSHVGSLDFTGAGPAVLEGALPSGALRGTANQVTLRYSSEGASDGLGFLYLRHLELGVSLDPGAQRAAVDSIRAYDETLPALGGVDYLIVTHATFVAEAERLARLKAQEGLRPLVVDVARAYDRYSAGVVEAEAVRRLIRDVRGAGQLRFVALLGDDTFDREDVLGTGAASFVPSLYGWDGEFGRVPSENRYADLNGDGRPDLAIGRLAAATVEQAALLVDKVARQATVLAKSRGRHLFVADNQAPGDPPFLADAQAVAGQYRNVRWSNLAEGVPQARGALEAGLSSGVAVTHYFGHGGPEIWADEALLSVNDAAALQNPETVVLQWACESQLYEYLWGPSLGEALLLNPRGGALASFGPAGITSTNLQAALAGPLYRELRRPGISLGEAIRRAKAAAMEDGSLRPAVEGFNLLGDPALKLGDLGVRARR